MHEKYDKASLKRPGRRSLPTVWRARPKADMYSTRVYSRIQRIVARTAGVIPISTYGYDFISVNRLTIREGDSGAHVPVCRRRLTLDATGAGANFREYVCIRVAPAEKVIIRRIASP